MNSENDRVLEALLPRYSTILSSFELEESKESQQIE
jgi:hypothetical protein